VVPPHILALGRWTIALLVMLPLIWRGRSAIISAVRTEWLHLIVLGALGTWICGAFVYIAGQSTSATNIALIYAAAPVGIAVGGSYFLAERLSPRQIVPMGCALAGLIFIICKGNVETLTQMEFVAGDLWILAATIAWIAYTICQQRWPTRLSALQRLFCATFAGVFMLLPSAIAEAFSSDMPWLSRQAFILMLIAGLVPGISTYLAYAFMVKHLGVARAALVIYLSPVYAVLLGWFLLGEAPHWYHLIGAALVLPSIYLSKSASR
jgi:drug/metabolite transporter (DMT)-like permease